MTQHTDLCRRRPVDGESDRGILPEKFAKLVTPWSMFQRAIDAGASGPLLPRARDDTRPSLWGDEAELDDALPTPRVRHLSAAYQIYLDFCRDHPSGPAAATRRRPR